MPLPRPSVKEERSKFVSRCVSELTKRGEGKDAAQRVAICNSRFRKSKAAQIELFLGELEALGVLIKKKKIKQQRIYGG